MLFSALPLALCGAIIGASPRAPVARSLAVGLVFFLVDTARSHLEGPVPWGLIGFSQIGSPGISQLASLGGVPLISGVLAALNAAVASSWTGNVRRRHASMATAAALAGLLAACALLAPGLPPPPERGEPHRVLIVQPNILAEERRADLAQLDNLRRVVGQTERELSRLGPPPALILWPEQILTKPLDQDESLRQTLEEAVAGFGVPTVAGVSFAGSHEGLRRSSAVWIDPERGITSRSDKVRGIPIVESGRGFPGDRLVERLVGTAAERGWRVEEAAAASPLGELELAVAFCFEVQFPGIVGAARSEKSVAVANLSNDSWMGSEALGQMQLAYARFRAIEQRLFVLRAAHGGISAVIDPTGRVVSALSFDAEGALVATVPWIPPRGLAGELGLVGVCAGGAFTGWLTFVWVSRRVRP